MLPLPNKVNPFVSALNRIASPWDSYLQQFTQAPPSAMAATVGASPWAYVAKEPGNLSVDGGTVSFLGFTRGIVTVAVTGQKLIPMCINDTITIIYSVLPTVYFLPSYGNAPR